MKIKAYAIKEKAGKLELFFYEQNVGNNDVWLESRIAIFSLSAAGITVSGNNFELIYKNIVGQETKRPNAAVLVFIIAQQ